MSIAKAKKLWGAAVTASFVCAFSTAAWAAGMTYTVSTPEELNQFAASVNAGNSFEGDTVFLGGPIALNQAVVDAEGELLEGDFAEWTPIGTETSPFKGTFNGNGNLVTGLYTNEEGSYLGLFGVTSGATIMNVTVKDSYLAGNNHAGAIAGYMKAGSVATCCFNDNTSVTASVTRAGGIVGWTDKSNVYNCGSSGYSYSKRCSGGIVGDVYSNGKIYNCAFYGKVDGGNLVGGISGGTTDADIRNCLTTGEIVANGGYLTAGGAGNRSIQYSYGLINDDWNSGHSFGVSSSSIQSFEDAFGDLVNPVALNGQEYETAVEVLNAWASSQEDGVIYAGWSQENGYPYLRDRVAPSVRWN